MIEKWTQRYSLELIVAYFLQMFTKNNTLEYAKKLTIKVLIIIQLNSAQCMVGRAALID